MDILLETLNGLDVVIGEAEPGEKVDLLETLDGDNVVVGQIEDLEMMKLAHLEHPHQLIVYDGKLQHKMLICHPQTWNLEHFIYSKCFVAQRELSSPRITI